MGLIGKNNAQLFLLLNSALWGTSYVWSKMLLGFLPRFSILLLCSIGGLISTLIIFRKSLRPARLSWILPSIIVSSFSIVSNTFFMLALQYTSSSNTAFIVQMSVIITPVLMAFLERRPPQKKIILSGVLALLGLFLITCDFRTFSINTGDLFALGNALFFSMQLAGLNLISKRVDSVNFTVVFHSTNAIGFLALALILETQLINPVSLMVPVFPALIAASICVGTLTALIQSRAIKFVRPEKAAIIYTLEPVTTLLVAAALMGERMEGIKPVSGCAVILLSVLVSSLGMRAKQLKKVPSGVEIPVKPALE